MANTLWVVNGLYATWPDTASNGDIAERTGFGTGVVGAFLFIVTGYLGYVEAINQTYTSVVLPSDDEKDMRQPFHGGAQIYGKWLGPLEHHVEDRLRKILSRGYPLVQDVASSRIVTAPLFERYVEKHGQGGLRGRKLSLLIGKHVVDVTVDELNASPEEEKKHTDKKVGYCWWTWNPDLRYMGILNALVFFVSTMFFFIPACAWLPMDRNGAPLGATIFWVQVMQVRIIIA
jgi:hypothetical protein